MCLRKSKSPSKGRVRQRRTKITNSNDYRERRTLKSSGVMFEYLNQPFSRIYCSSGYKPEPAKIAKNVKNTISTWPRMTGNKSIAVRRKNAGTNMAMHPPVDRGILKGRWRSGYLESRATGRVITKRRKHNTAMHHSTGNVYIYPYLIRNQINATNSNNSAMQYTIFKSSTICRKLKLHVIMVKKTVRMTVLGLMGNAMRFKHKKVNCTLPLS